MRTDKPAQVMLQGYGLRSRTEDSLDRARGWDLHRRAAIVVTSAHGHPRTAGVSNRSALPGLIAHPLETL
jgi:hypothetical protein